MKIQMMNIDDIHPYTKNPRKNQKAVAPVKKSLKEYGFQQPIVVDKDMIVVVGHTRLLAAKELKIKEVPVHIADNLTEDQCRAYRIADNKTNEFASWDEGFLTDELKNTGDLFTGFSDAELDWYRLEQDAKENDIPELKESSVIEMGDMFILGGHKLICGDSTDPEVYESLFHNEINKAKLCFSSPPYNMGAALYKMYKDNRTSSEYIDFNINVLKNVKAHLSGFVFWNMSYNKRTRSEFIDILYKLKHDVGLNFLELITWFKNNAIYLHPTDMLSRDSEQIYVFENEEEPQTDAEQLVIMRTDGSSQFNKPKNKKITNHWSIKTANGGAHNTKRNAACFPVELPERGIMICTDPDDIVIEPFCGSGTTIIASHKQKRRCFGIELDNIQVEQAIQRWEEYSGQIAIHYQTGLTLKELNEKRDDGTNNTPE